MDIYDVGTYLSGFNTPAFFPDEEWYHHEEEKGGETEEQSGEKGSKEHGGKPETHRHVIKQYWRRPTLQRVNEHMHK